MSVLVRCDGGCGKTVELEREQRHFGGPHAAPPGWYGVGVFQFTERGPRELTPGGVVCSAECAAGVAGRAVERDLEDKRTAAELVCEIKGCQRPGSVWPAGRFCDAHASAGAGSAAMTCRVGGCERPVRAPDSGFCEAHATFTAPADPVIERAVDLVRERPRPAVERIVPRQSVRARE